MKLFIGILISLLACLSLKTNAQNGSVFHLNKLSQKDTLLTGWKIYVGDNPAFSNPSFDDSEWQTIDLSQDIRQYRKLRTSGIIWLRLHVNVDSSLARENLAAHIVQYTASEVYLNGELLGKYGIVSRNPKKVSAYLPSALPFQITLKENVQNVIAVRVAYEAGLPYLSYLVNSLPVFQLFINRRQAAFDNYYANEHQLKIYVIIFSISSGTLLIIGFIYFVYFLFDRSRKVHLYYSLSALALCLNALPIEVFGADRYGPVSWGQWIFYLEDIALTSGMLLMVMTIYALFNYPYRWVFKGLLLAGTVGTIAIYIYGDFGYSFANIIFPIACLLEGCYACIWAIRRNKKDAVVILAGVILYIVFTSFTALIPLNSVAGQLLFYIAQMFFPIGMSIYLGIQSSITNKKLRRSLREVQQLSERNLAHEHEKQQILSSQNEMLERQVGERTFELKQSLDELKSTQAQLIQSEKMASLGELTAGIAHEIQNPLNFVNNFSDVSSELLDEMKTELDKGNMEEALSIADNVKQNLEKINHHGKRADGIVKGMLQHSRTSSGQKELTDVNALVDEYLRLAYHGLRAKDKSFNARFETDFDSRVGKVNIIQQDIGRVILNLINNAFYAVSEKKKGRGDDYEPTVTVTTTRDNGRIEVSVKDNGSGIPKNIVDKIFQPFFTTKPAGQGTGLGLSLAYDIVKAHGGDIKVETKEGVGTEFVIQVPATTNVP